MIIRSSKRQESRKKLEAKWSRVRNTLEIVVKSVDMVKSESFGVDGGRQKASPVTKTVSNGGAITMNDC